MEPKTPIYVDEVDVSGCEFYCDKYCSLSNDRNEQLPFAEICSEYSNCLFKQLARKEYECQRTEQKLILIRDFITDIQIRSSATSVCDKILQIIDEVEG